MTPQWLGSKWCWRELEWWCERHHPDTLDVGSRVFVCRVRPSDEDTWPEPLKGVAGYFATTATRSRTRHGMFTWRGSTRDLDDYNDLLVDLSGDFMSACGRSKQLWSSAARAMRGRHVWPPTAGM